MKIVVVGGGVVGLSTAYALLEAGCEVTVIDAHEIPNPASASYDRSRMMRLQYGPQRGYAYLARRALSSWMELEQTLGVRLYHPTGVCVWSATAEAWTAATAGALDDIGVVYRKASFEADAGRAIDHSGLGHGVYTHEGGVLLADRAVTALATAAVRKGAQLRPSTPLYNVDTERGLVRTTDGLVVEADAVLVAIGAWTSKLLLDFVHRVTPIRSIAVYVAPPEDLALEWSAAPCTMIETQESMLYALPPVPEAPLKLAGTANLQQADPDRPQSVSPQEAESVLEAFRPYLRNISGYRIIGNAMGHYADPPNKTFIVERQGRSVIVSGCGGRMFKFAPLLGAEIAAVLTGRAPATTLDHWSKPLVPPQPRH